MLSILDQFFGKTTDIELHYKVVVYPVKERPHRSNSYVVSLGYKDITETREVPISVEIIH